MELLDPDWRTDCGTLIEFVRRTFTHEEFGITVCHEQDEDKQAWGGINSTYGAVLALYAKATGSLALADEARQELVKLLTAHDVPLIEDDVYAELYFGSRRPTSTKAFDRKGLVLNCGSFSKCLAPGYRIGWVAARLARAGSEGDRAAE